MDSIRKGQLSKELLDNPLLKETLEIIESALIDQWKDSNDSKVREEVWYTLAGLRRFRGVLEIAVQNGEADYALQEKYNG